MRALVDWRNRRRFTNTESFCRRSTAQGIGDRSRGSKEGVKKCTLFHGYSICLPTLEKYCRKSHEGGGATSSIEDGATNQCSFYGG